MTMKITWTESGAECSLGVWVKSSLGFRFATLVDLKRANEAAGLLHDYVDRDEAFEREQKLKVRLAVLEAEQAAYLDALAVDGLRPTTVLAGIDSLKTVAAGLREEVADADARMDAAMARAEKADSDLTAARERIAELEGELYLTNGVNRRAAQSIVECIGSVGPEDADSAAERIVSRLLELERANACARATINAVDKVLTLEARHPPSLDIVGRVRGLAAQANGLAKIIETRGNIIAELEAQLQAAQDTSIADRAMDKFYAEGIDPHGVLHGIDLAIERAKKAEAERDLAKHDFELANEAYDELQARLDELASSPERIALLEALEPHDPNAARAAAAMKREHEAALAVLGAREGEDLLAAARRAVVLADVYRAHYRRAVISNFTTDRAMTEGLAECERLRARIAELEAVAAERESLREAVWEFERLLRERVGGGKA